MTIKPASPTWGLLFVFKLRLNMLAAAEAGTKFTIFDLSALKKQILIFIGKYNNKPLEGYKKRRRHLLYKVTPQKR